MVLTDGLSAVERPKVRFTPCQTGYIAQRDQSRAFPNMRLSASAFFACAAKGLIQLNSICSAILKDINQLLESVNAQVLSFIEHFISNYTFLYKSTSLDSLLSNARCENADVLYNIDAKVHFCLKRRR